MRDLIEWYLSLPEHAIFVFGMIPFCLGVYLIALVIGEMVFQMNRWLNESGWF